MKLKNLNNNCFDSKSISFYTIFFVELWERFGYYGFQSILIIYFVRLLIFTEYEAILIFSSFSALVYGFISIGGWLSDKIIGAKRSIIIGLIILTIGYFLLSFSNHNHSLIYLGMSFIAVGNGLFKVNPSSLITNIYKDKLDFDSAFTIFYMSINIGSFFSMIISPYIAIKFGWNIAFFISFIGLFISLLTFIIFYKNFDKFGSKSDYEKISFNKFLLLSSFIIFSIFISYFLIKNYFLTKILLLIISIFIIMKLFNETIKLTYKEKILLIIAYIMIFESMLFFILYGLMPTSLNFFSIHHINNKMFNISFNPEQFQALNPMWIIILSPIFSIYHNSIGKNLQITYKFSIGMFLCSISFLILSIGVLFCNKEYIISSYWLLLSYLFQSSGELMISGLGLSMIAKYAPKQLTGFIMGFWFLIYSSSAILSGNLANCISNSNINIFNKLESIHRYNLFFLKLGIISIIISFIMLFIAWKIEKFLKNNKINI